MQKHVPTNGADSVGTRQAASATDKPDNPLHIQVPSPFIDERKSRGTGRGFRGGVAFYATALIMTILIIGQVTYYFGPYLDEYVKHFREVEPGPDGQDAILRSTDFPDWTRIHLISSPVVDEAYHEGLAAFLTRAYEVDVINADRFGTRYLDNLSYNVDHAFFVAADDADSIAILREKFDMEPEPSPYDLPEGEEFVLFYAPRPQRFPQWEDSE